MRWSEMCREWTQYTETLKRKWNDQFGGMVSALRAEEMKLRREEVLRQIENDHRSEQRIRESV